MPRLQFSLATVAITAAVGLLSVTPSNAGKPSKPGGGGGGSLSYSIVRLDDGNGTFLGSEPLDINDNGEVVGYLNAPNSYYVVAAYWEVNGLQSQVSPLIGGIRAEAINEHSEIVGAGLDGDGNWTAMYWSGPTAAPIMLPALDDGLESNAFDINDDGVIVGESLHAVSDDDGQPRPAGLPVAWRVVHVDGVPEVFGPVMLPLLDDSSEVHALSDCDADGVATVVGASRVLNGPRNAAVQWTVLANPDGTLSVDPLPLTLESGNATAYGINNQGIACGEGPVPSSLATRARLWADGLTLLLNSNIGARSRARDVNDAGLIVGAGGPNLADLDAVVWPTASGSPVPLEKFLPKRNSPFTFLVEASAVNEAGLIVGWGGNAGQYPSGFIAVPN